MRRLLRVILGATLSLLSTSCIPRDKPISPDIDVEVVDAITRLPIRGAAVTVWGNEYPDQKASAITDEKGRAVIPSQTNTIWMFPAVVPFAAPTGRVHIEAAGYQSADVDAEDVRYNSEHQPIALAPTKPR